MKYLRRFALLLLTLILCLGIFAFYQFHASSFDYQGSLDAGVKDEVQMYFDDYAVPHIYANNAEDAYFALGYVAAAERYFQADMMRRIGTGRLAEVFGKDLLKTDKLFRTLGLVEHGKKSLSKMDSNAQYMQLSKDYLRGFNHWVQEWNKPLEYKILGLDMEEFDMEDMLAISGYMAFSFDKGLKTDAFFHKLWQEQGPERMKYFKTEMYIPDSLSASDSLRVNILQELEALGQLLEGLPQAPLMASNAWAVAPERSKSGKVLFSNDTHIRNSIPSTWYEAHIEYGDFSFYGNFLPGIPFALVGHSRDHAWGLTMLQNDDSDVFIEEFREDDLHYFHDGDWKKVIERKEVIKVKGEADEVFNVRKTVHGPLVQELIDGQHDQALALHWTYLKFPNNLLEVFYQLNHSKELSDCYDAASKIAAPGLNLIYGNSNGDIAHFACAKLIKRDSIYSKVLLKGDGTMDIEEYFDFDYNPKRVNPESGFVYSANEQHDIFKGYTHQGYYSCKERANQISEFIAEDKRGIEDLKKLVYANNSPRDKELATFLIAALLEKELSDRENDALQILKNWNGSYNSDEKGPIIYQNFLYYIYKNVFYDEIGEDDFNQFIGLGTFKSHYREILLDKENIWWQVGLDQSENKSPNELINLSFSEAINNIVEKIGKDQNNWEWAKCHKSYFGHPLGKVKPLNLIFDKGPFPSPGSSVSVNAQNFSLNDRCDFRVSSGAQMRIMIDFADIENAESISPVGQSGHASSKHYSDQCELFVNGQFRRMDMRKSRIQESERKVIFYPLK